MNMIRNEIERTRAEIKGGACSAMLMLIGVIVLLCATGCANKRFYIGMDDYGETESMDHTFKTKRQQGGK